MARTYKWAQTRVTVEDLVNLGKPSPDSPPLAVGDWCKPVQPEAHVSFDEPMMVVDVIGIRVVLASPEGIEKSMPRALVRRTQASA
jgi:hypothetical protein